MAHFFIRWKRKSWSLLEEKWKDGKREQVTVPKDLYSHFGFRHDMPYEEAKARAKQLNKKNKIDKSAAVAAARRTKFEQAVEQVFLDEAQAEEFKRELTQLHFGSANNTKNLMFRWNTIQALVLEFKIEPHEFGKNSRLFYKHFQTQAYSNDYVAKLLRVLNLWGSFVCRKQGRHYEPVKTPKGQIREAINEAYQAKETSRAGGANPLTSYLIKDKIDELEPGYKEWVLISFWFGLRPQEIDSLHNPKNWKLTIQPDGVQVLHIYQSKLTAVAIENRWKLIPVLYPEQTKALEFIKLRQHKRPTVEAIQKVFGDGFGLYSGRKGFGDEMRDREHLFDHVSSWLGHRSLDITYKRYISVLRVQYTKPGKYKIK